MGLGTLKLFPIFQDLPDNAVDDAPVPGPALHAAGEPDHGRDGGSHQAAPADSGTVWKQDGKVGDTKCLRNIDVNQVVLTLVEQKNRNNRYIVM